MHIPSKADFEESKEIFQIPDRVYSGWLASASHPVGKLIEVGNWKFEVLPNLFFLWVLKIRYHTPESAPGIRKVFPLLIQPDGSYSYSPEYHRSICVNKNIGAEDKKKQEFLIMSKIINLTKGKQAVVDDEDYPELSKHKWMFSGSGYASRTNKSILMHRVIMSAPRGLEVDHINMDKLDNRKENLRLCTPTQNRMNTGLRSNNKTGYKGVFYYKRTGKYAVAIAYLKKRIHLGYYDSAEEAALVYNKKSKELYGEFARLNGL